MKALLYRETLISQKQIKFWLMITLFDILINAKLSNYQPRFSTLVFIAPVIFETFSDEEKSKNLKLLFTTGITRLQWITSKFILAISCILITCIIQLTHMYLTNGNITLDIITILKYSCTIILLIAIIPLAVKIKVIPASIFVFCIYVIQLIVVNLYSLKINEFVLSNIENFAIYSLITTIAITLILYLLSLKLINNKNF